MPGHGPAPKPPQTRRRGNKKTTAASFTAPSAARVKLPPRPPGDPWHPLTQAWWDIIWASPMRAEWNDADIPTLFRIAKLDHAFWNSSEPLECARLAGQINTLSRNFGLDPMSRRTLQWEIRRAEAPQRGAIPQPTAQRDPRLKAVG